MVVGPGFAQFLHQHSVLPLQEGCLHCGLEVTSKVTDIRGIGMRGLGLPILGTMQAIVVLDGVLAQLRNTEQETVSFFSLQFQKQGTRIDVG